MSSSSFFTRAFPLLVAALGTAAVAEAQGFSATGQFGAYTTPPYAYDDLYAEWVNLETELVEPILYLGAYQLVAVANDADDRVVFLTPNPLTVHAEVVVGQGPTALARNPGTGELWVSVRHQSSVVVLASPFELRNGNGYGSLQRVPWVMPARIAASLVGVIALVFVAVMFWAKGTNRGGTLEEPREEAVVRRDEPQESLALQEALSREPDAPSKSPRIPGGQEQPGTTARLFLQEYWGKRWPEIEQAMLKARIDLDQPYEPVDWETAAAVLEPMVLLTPSEQTAETNMLRQWPTDLQPESMVDWLRREFVIPKSEELDDADLLAIDDIVRAANDEIAVLAREWVDRIDFFSMEKWRSGDFVRAPFGTIGVSKELGFHSKTAAASGWSFVITLTRERYPDMVALEDRAAELREARDKSVTEYLRKRFAR